MDPESRHALGQTVHTFGSLGDARRVLSSPGWQSMSARWRALDLSALDNVGDFCAHFDKWIR
jgi:hypothetical protein